MPILAKQSKRTPTRKTFKGDLSVAGNAMQERNFQQVSAVSAHNTDWPVVAQTADSDVWANIYLLRQRCRDLFNNNPYFVSLQGQSIANTFGDTGMQLRMKIKETEDRVVYAPEEKLELIAHERRMNKVIEWANKKLGRDHTPYTIFERDARGEATIQVGQPDLYACKVIQQGWAAWKEAQYADARGTRDYDTICQIRLISAMRDGDFFMRMVRDPGVNEFGFTLQLVNAEYCDYWLNTTLANGNVIRMGIEYKWHSWGLGKPVNYYFLKQQPMDWQWSNPGTSFGNANLGMYDIIPADQVIHYARYTSNDSTRPAPWCASVIPKARQLDKYEEAEVIAARVAACKMGWLYSDMVPEGGFGQGAFPVDSLPNPKKQRVMNAEPGSFQALDWGVKFQEFNPNHPNGNFEEFRKGMLRSITAGMPGATYSGLASDYENINFSAGRLERLNITEMWELIQAFDIRTAEKPIFEQWLQMALITGAVPLPLAKYKSKYAKRAAFQGRRWEGIDPIKEQQASALAIANKLSSRTRICSERGIDFDENLMELAEEEMKLEALGMSTMTTAETPPPVAAPAKEGNEEDEEEEETPKPKKKARTNGHRLNIGA